MLFSDPASSAIIRIEISNFTNNTLIGNRYEYSGIGGRPVNIISLTSPEFPITEITNNNTSLVNVSFTGGNLRPGSPYSFELNVEDNPDGTSGFTIVKYFQIISTSTGVQEVPLPTFTISSNTSSGALTPFSAFNIINTGQLNGQNVSIGSTYQFPGNQLIFSNTSFPVPLAFTVSSQPIAGYVPFDQLNNFGTPAEFILQPGDNLTFTQSVSPTSTPEPNLVGSLSAISLVAFLKRKLSKISNSKA